MEKEVRRKLAPGAGKKRFVKLDVHEVSFVDDGANEEEQFLTVKRKKKEKEMGDLFEKIFGASAADDDGDSDETEKTSSSKAIQFFKGLTEKIEAIGTQLDALDPKETEKPDGDETEKAKRMTDSRLGKIKGAYEKLGELIEEIEANPAAMAKRESDKLRGEMKAAFEKVGDMFTAIEKKLESKSDDEKADDADKKKTKKADDEKADDEKADDADKKKTKKADDEKDETEKADSRETPDDGDETETEKDKPASPFRGFFGGTGVGKSIEKHRAGK